MDSFDAQRKMREWQSVRGALAALPSAVTTHEYQRVGPAYATDPTIVLDHRFAHAVSVHHHRQICSFTSPIGRERFCPASERRERMKAYGFNFAEPSRMLTHLGFWRMLGPQVGQFVNPCDWDRFVFQAEGSDPDFHVFVNVLNGGADVDYEVAFPWAKNLFNLIAIHKFAIDPAQARHRSGRSVLSVPDIILALVLERGMRFWGDDEREKGRHLAAQILDARIPNAVRVELRSELAGIAASRHIDAESSTFPHLLDATNLLFARLAIASRDAVEWSPDVLVPLHGGHCENAAYHARRLVSSSLPGAFVVPVGSTSPHELLVGGQAIRGFSEAQSMVAALFEDPYHDRFGQAVEPSPPLMSYDVLPTVPFSTDTVSNVQEVLPVLKALRAIRGRSIRTLLITSHQHADRARYEFSQGLPQHIADVRVLSQEPDVAVMSQLSTTLSPVGIGNLFCEVAKRLYIVSVA